MRTDGKEEIISKEEKIIKCNQGDIIGLYLEYNNLKKGKLGFYHNSSRIELWFEDIPQNVKPVVGVGEDSEITLDSRVGIPLEIYRHL